MNMMRYRPSLWINSFSSDLNRLLSEFNNTNREAESTWSPAIDIRDEKDCLVIFADIPGIDPKDLDIHLENNTLTIKGERKFEHKETEDNYIRTERVYGNFYRSFPLPSTVDSEKIEAKTSQGVLEIRLTKKSVNQGKKIAIKSA